MNSAPSRFLFEMAADFCASCGSDLLKRPGRDTLALAEREAAFSRKACDARFRSIRDRSAPVLAVDPASNVAASENRRQNDVIFRKPVAGSARCRRKDAY